MEDIRSHFKNGVTQKTLVLLRGSPGSGKSTEAKNLQNMVEDACIFETDEFFMREDGVYVYDKSKLAEYHRLNQQRAKKAMDEGRRVIIISNTNICLWEMREYVCHATLRGYEILFGVCDGKFPNQHGVPTEEVEKKRKQIEQVKSVEQVMRSYAPFEKASSFYVSKEIPRDQMIESAHLLLPLIDKFGMEVILKAIKKMRQVRRKCAYHVTLVPPGCKLDLMEELEARRMAETMSVVITGVGYVDESFYFTCDLDPSVMEWRAQQMPGQTYYPHITVGFVEQDVHNVPKTRNLDPRPPVNSDEITLCELLIDPEVDPDYRSCDGFECVMYKARVVPGIGDDITYINNPDLGKKLRRGHAFWRSVVEKEPWAVGALGLPKFSGMKGSEDDTDAGSSNDDMSHVNIEKIRAEADEFVLSIKENGAAGCLRFLKVLGDEKFLVLVGTKLVISFFEYSLPKNHFRALTNVTKNQERNAVAFKVLLKGCYDVNTTVHELLRGGITIVAEILDRSDKHIVEYTEKEDICAVVLALTLPNGDPADLSQADSWGMRTMKRQGPYPIAELLDRLTPDQETEGYVVTYYKDRVEVGKEKFKSCTYVFKRSIRQVTMSFITSAVKLLEGKRATLKKRKADLSRIRSDKIRSEKEAEIAHQETVLASCVKDVAVQRAMEVERQWIRDNKFSFLNVDWGNAVCTMKKFLEWYGIHFETLPQKADEFSRVFPDVWGRFSTESGFTGFL